MPEDEVKTRVAGLLEQLAASPPEMEGLDLDDLKAAMSHPKALETLTKWMPLEASSAQPGAPAPDFSLPYMPGYGPDGESMTLSSHFGSRPVALVFGSYT